MSCGGTGPCGGCCRGGGASERSRASARRSGRSPSSGRSVFRWRRSRMTRPDRGPGRQRDRARLRIVVTFRCYQRVLPVPPRSRGVRGIGAWPLRRRPVRAWPAPRDEAVRRRCATTPMSCLPECVHGSCWRLSRRPSGLRANRRSADSHLQADVPSAQVIVLSQISITKPAPLLRNPLGQGPRGQWLAPCPGHATSDHATTGMSRWCSEEQRDSRFQSFAAHRFARPASAPISGVQASAGVHASSVC
ncbi:hypothetical protein MPEAHAMD_0586 [Methylobacterium frigidaeris]|uniref:Uncharacterized protein n=1 Tax=Methylobacterium frigidaeris TaxID=2038277 RepID=A0AA37H7Y3_9HYPH|nr:hypothetical protein MPEAHAMD_0586 [Methylobacterium frigidaeris]